jgi:hypothetical protein
MILKARDKVIKIDFNFLNFDSLIFFVLPAIFNSLNSKTGYSYYGLLSLKWKFDFPGFDIQYAKDSEGSMKEFIK